MKPDVERVAILTGAGGGLGRAIAADLAGEGWRLVLTDRAGSSLDEAQTAIGDDAEAVACDVRSEDGVVGVVQHAMRRWGRIDGFVSNAGVPGVVQPMHAYPADAFRDTMDVNVLGTFFCLKHGLAAMRQAGSGSFVAIGSTSSIRGRAGLSAYVASKHAVLGLIRSAALEQVNTAVRVNAVLPGPIQTAMIDAIDAMAGRTEGGVISRATATPYGTPADVAHAVAFLLSAQSRHMNGSAMVIDGGSTLA